MEGGFVDEEEVEVRSVVEKGWRGGGYGRGCFLEGF